MSDVEGFLRELSALTARYGIKVDACGCCASPFLVSTDADPVVGEILADGVDWVHDRYMAVQGDTLL